MFLKNIVESKLLGLTCYSSYKLTSQLATVIDTRAHESVGQKPGLLLVEYLVLAPCVPALHGVMALRTRYTLGVILFHKRQTLKLGSLELR